MLHAGTRRRRVIVDSSTISSEASADVRAEAQRHGTALLAAPVSGNPKVVAAGRLTVVASGPRDAYDMALPYLELFGSGVTYVGEGDGARLVKICHNLFLGVVAQSLAEIAVLAENGGVARRDFFEFLNQSVMGSTFTRYKTPAYVNRNYTPTFTLELLRKDFDLGLAAATSWTCRCPRCGSCGAGAGADRRRLHRRRLRRADRARGRAAQASSWLTTRPGRRWAGSTDSPGASDRLTCPSQRCNRLQSLQEPS